MAGLDGMLRDTIKPDLWVLHTDAWAYRETCKQVANQIPLVTYSPIDGGHISSEEYESISCAQERVAMCDYAEREIKKTGLSCVKIPHGVNPKVFKPQDKMKWREIFGLPKDEFVLGFVGTNISKRKGQAEMFMGLKEAWDAGKRFTLVMITNIDGVDEGGYNLFTLADYVGLPKHILKFPAASYQFTEEELCGWYNSFDVLVNLTRGEGFGIPVLESAACGTPVIATDWTSMPELVDGHGMLIPVQALDIYTLKTQFLAIPDYKAFGKAVVKCIDNPDLVKSMGKRATKFAEKYDWDKLAPRWDKLFRRLEGEGFFPPYNVRQFK